MPPATTEMTGPNSAAVNPDSSAPNSLDVPMKMLFTAETRPRISSGVTSCTMDPRMITLTLSNAPIRNNTTSENQNALDKPKMMVAMPKADAPEQGLAGLFHRRPMRHRERNRESA